MTIEKKLIKYGYSSIIVLPKYWIEMQGLNRQDKLILTIQKDGSLLIRRKDDTIKENA